MPRVILFLVVMLLSFAAPTPAQDLPAKKKSSAIVVYFPNNRYVRGEVLTLTDLTISLYVDGKLESYNPALTKVIAVQTADGWQRFDAPKKKFVRIEEAEALKIVGNASLKPLTPDKPASTSSGPVQIVNTNKETIRIVTKSFIDATGQKHILVRTFDVKPSESDYVQDINGNAIKATQISFTLITKNGSSQWSAGIKEFDGTAIQVVIKGDKIAVPEESDKTKDAKPKKPKNN